MLFIENLDRNVIDLNDLKSFSCDFNVISNNEKGKRIPYHITLITNPNIVISTFGINSLNITIKVENILKDEYIFLKNILNEELIIKIKPNVYFTNERKYKFKISKAELKDNGDLKLRILSKVNNSEIGWKCIYDGKPMNYVISPTQSNKSSYVNVKSTMKLFDNFTSIIKFQQEESNEIIEFKIINTPNGMEIKKEQQN